MTVNRLAMIASRQGTGCIVLALGALLFLVSGEARAQVSAAAASASTAAASGSGADGASGTQITSIFQVIPLIPKCCAKLKACFCSSCLGQLTNAMMAPITLASGGCIQCCPPVPSKEDKAKPGAQGACAMLTADAQEARKRMQAVKCLASADCNWWPEAEVALIGYLRADKNECVRLFSAQVLGRGCCCTPNVMKALELSATGSDADGNPRESSARVRAAARAALARCNCHYIDYNQLDKAMQANGPSVAPVEKPPAAATTYEEPTEFYDQFSGKLDAQMAAEIRSNLSRQPSPVAPPPSSRPASSIADTGSGNDLWSIVKHAVRTEPPAAPQPTAADPMAGRIVKAPLPPRSAEVHPQGQFVSQGAPFDGQQTPMMAATPQGMPIPEATAPSMTGTPVPQGIYMPQMGDDQAGPELPPLTAEEEAMVRAAEQEMMQQAAAAGVDIAPPASTVGQEGSSKKRFWQRSFRFTGFRGNRTSSN